MRQVQDGVLELARVDLGVPGIVGDGELELRPARPAHGAAARPCPTPGARRWSAAARAAGGGRKREAAGSGARRARPRPRRCAGGRAPRDWSPTSAFIRSRLAWMTCRMLLKSCAMPPVSWPIASIFWPCRSAASSRSFSVTSTQRTTAPPSGHLAARDLVFAAVVARRAPSACRRPATRRASAAASSARIAGKRSDSSRSRVGGGCAPGPSRPAGEGFVPGHDTARRHRARRSGRAASRASSAAVRARRQLALRLLQAPAAAHDEEHADDQADEGAAQHQHDRRDRPAPARSAAWPAGCDSISRWPSTKASATWRI